MMRNTRNCILTATAFFAMNTPALAETAYPAKPIRMVVPFSPGGTSDTLARILGQKITETRDQQVVVDSRPAVTTATTALILPHILSLRRPAMGQVTIYLDANSEARLRKAAAKAGVPLSRWVSKLVQEKTRTDWPESVRRLAGAWRKDTRIAALGKTRGKDIPRESL